MRLQPPHLHLVAQTDLIEHLRQCLLLDTSSTVVDLAVTILIMFIPHITSSLVSYLPTMLLIYGRILCWDDLNLPFDPEKAELQEGRDPYQSDEEYINTSTGQSWHILSNTFDNAESANPRVDYLFTFLYGLFPINFMAFIRKPRKYLKAAEYPGADDLNMKQDMIRARTEPHRQAHLLHPNFYLSTQEEELNENRWIKADAADVVTECLNLCTSISASLKDPGPPPTGKLPAIPRSQLRKMPSNLEVLPSTDDEMTSPTEGLTNSSWRNTQSTGMTSYSTHWQPEPLPKASKSRASSSHGKPRSSRGTSPAARSRDVPPDSPTLRPRQDPAHASIATAEIPLNLLDEQRRTSQSTTATLTSPRFASFTQALSAAQFPTPPSRSPNATNKVASLQRENMLLRNDLNFERYLKQQHLSHIGQLQRKHIREATVEAETQNLINSTRTLKAKLAKANQQYEQLKKETTTSRSQSKKFEAELTSKVRTYREEERNWQSEEDKLRAECDTLKKDCDHLRRLLVESEQREFNMANQLQMRKEDIEELDSVRKEVQGLSDKLRDYEQRELHFEQVEEERLAVQTEMEAFKMRTASKDAERERNRRNLEIKVKDLEAKLETSRPTSQSTQSGQLPATVQQMLDSALAASQSRFNQLKKAHTRLLQKYTELEMKYTELGAGHDIDAGPSHPFNAPRGHDFDPPGTSSSNGLGHSPSVSRRPRGFSESLMAEVDDIMNADYSGSSHGSGATALPSRGTRDQPSRFETVNNRQQALERARERESQMDGNLSGFLSYNPTKPLSMNLGNAPSTTSVDSKGSDGRPKDKVKPQSEVRVYGRGMLTLAYRNHFDHDADILSTGGAQNIGSKSKSKSSGDAKAKGGLKGIRGIM